MTGEDGSVRLHYNAECGHQDLPLTPLRILYATGQYEEALDEAIRLDKLPLEVPERLVINVHEVMVRRALDRVSYAEAAERLEMLAEHVAKLDDPNFIAGFNARRIRFAAHFGDHALAAELVSQPTFFAPPVDRTVHTEAHWRLALGGREQIKDPMAAIPYYQTVVHNLDGAGRPCLREMAARRLAFCVDHAGNKSRPTAVTVLRNIQLPVRLSPAAGELALAPLLQVPLW